jgi:cytochrome oxidase assembly protein ShyY1
VDVEQIQEQVSYPLLPFYIKQSPEPGLPGLPARVEPVVNLSAARHIHYVIFWFSLATMTAVGYVGFVRSLRVAAPAAKRAPRPPAGVAYQASSAEQ